MIDGVSIALLTRKATTRRQLGRRWRSVRIREDGGLLGVGHQFGRVIGRDPAALRHQLLHAVGGALGLHDADVERQVGAREQAFQHLGGVRRSAS